MRSLATAEDVLARVNELVPTLRSRAAQTENLRQMHPDNLRDLTQAGVFRLTMPSDTGGYQADDGIVSEVLAQIARGCPSTSWICTIMVAVNVVPALLHEEVGAEIYSTPDLKMTATVAPTGRAEPVDGGYRVTGRWLWNSGGVHSNWFVPHCITSAEGSTSLLAVIPRSEVQYQDTWRAAGMVGTATNLAVVDDVFVPAGRTLSAENLAKGTYPSRRYSQIPYYNRPWLMYINTVSAPTLLGTARGAMDVFMATLAERGGITFTNWSKASEAPVVHHQLAKAQLALDGAEMFATRLVGLHRGASAAPPTLTQRVQARAWLGHVATLARECVNLLFEVGGASQVLLSADLQRYFRDINVLHQHALIQPSTSGEIYGRHLAGLEPNSELI